MKKLEGASCKRNVLASFYKELNCKIILTSLKSKNFINKINPFFRYIYS